jgi:hypothetical protein
MADLGEISITMMGLNPDEARVSSLTWRPGNKIAPVYPDESDSIAGTVSVEGVVQARVRVLLLDVTTRQVVKEAKTDLNGDYLFTNLNPTDEYVALAVTPDSVNYNSLVYQV